MDKDKLIKYRQAVQNLLSRYVAEDVTAILFLLVQNRHQTHD